MIRRFVGEHTAHGLEHGRVYVLELHNTHTGLVAILKRITWPDVAPLRFIELAYDGWEDFKKEWEEA